MNEAYWVFSVTLCLYSNIYENMFINAMFSTLISHNIKTTCLILCRPPSCCQNSSDALRHGLHKTSECVLWYWHHHISSRSFKSCKLGSGASLDQICWSSTSQRCSIGLRSVEFGRQDNTLKNSLSCSSNHSWTSSLQNIAHSITLSPPLWPVWCYAAPYAANCDVLCVQTPFIMGRIKFLSNLNYSGSSVCWTRRASFRSTHSLMSLGCTWPLRRFTGLSNHFW